MKYILIALMLLTSCVEIKSQGSPKVNIHKGKFNAQHLIVEKFAPFIINGTAIYFRRDKKIWYQRPNKPDSLVSVSFAQRIIDSLRSAFNSIEIKRKSILL